MLFFTKVKKPFYEKSHKPVKVRLSWKYLPYCLYGIAHFRSKMPLFPIEGSQNSLFLTVNSCANCELWQWQCWACHILASSSVSQHLDSILRQSIIRITWNNICTNYELWHWRWSPSYRNIECTDVTNTLTPYYNSLLLESHIPTVNYGIGDEVFHIIT